MSDENELPELAEIHAGLEEDGYYVAPELASEFTPAELTQLGEALESTQQPTYVVAFPLRATDVFSGSASDLITRLHDAYPEPGTYLSNTDDISSDDGTPVRLEGRQYDIPGQPDSPRLDYDVTDILDIEEPDDLAAAFLRSVELLQLDSTSLSDLATETRDNAPDRFGGDGDDGAGPLLILPAALVAGIVLILVSRHRRGLPLLSAPRSDRRPTTPEPSAGERAALVLPAATLDRIRDAGDRRLAEQARDEVLAVGVSLDRVRLESDAERVGWQIAVDHYQAARDLLEALPTSGREVPDVLDVVGAIVLARRAQDALLAVRRGPTWSPRSSCFVHPLHPRPSARIAVGATSHSVPVCDDCLDDIRSGRTPDALQVRRQGRLVPYYETDREPWASTGFGALEPDLLGALRDHGRR